MSVRWLAESLDEGAVAARVGREGDRLVAEWPGRARLSVCCDGSDAVFEPNAEAAAADADKLRRGAVRLLLAHLHGSIPLHGSAVTLGGRAIVLVGASKLGKSTLAAALCEHSGASLLADDAVAVERRADGFHVLALEERHWLDVAAARALGRADGESVAKAPLVPRDIATESAPLAMVAHLAFSDHDETPRVVPVGGLDAIAGLLAQLTRLVVDDPVVARRDLAALGDLVDRTRVVRVERPRRLELLELTANLVAASAQR